MGARLDTELVARGLARSRALARESVESGKVQVNGVTCLRPAHKVVASDVIETTARVRFVSRGGVKLQAALDRFEIPVQGLRCLDVGASTGGFTDCLLQAGAAQVVSVDVGHGQFDPALRADPRVVVYEKINIRETPPAPWTGTFGLIVVDVSFISLGLVLPSLWPWAGPDAGVVLLVKPQFECGRAAIGKGGVVRDPQLRWQAVEGVQAWVNAQPGWKIFGVEPSPITGGDGNEEFLLVAGRGAFQAVVSGLVSPPATDKVRG
ncbi:MAG: TlyA family RNA methyltransferase [Candidatus Methylacidiphilales bacterium]|nr:TlyA family RNA methyltransferase [Candidatus Methylacidiphilales bacterium]